jgi:hypothetical protein
MVSKYKELIPKVLKSDEIMSTNQVREAVAKLAGIKRIEFNLVYHLLDELSREGKVKKVKGSKRAFYWMKK